MATYGWVGAQFDVSTAFLYGELEDGEELYVEQPTDFKEPGKEDWVWRLKKGLYGLKQGSRVWNRTLNSAFEGWQFKRLDCEWCVYYRNSPTGQSIVVVHVDDMTGAFSCTSERNRFEAELRSTWQITTSELVFGLGIGMERDLAARTIALEQHALIDRIVAEYAPDAWPVSTPMRSDTRLHKPDPTRTTHTH